MEFSGEISVLMATYNTPVHYLQEAVESILNQTFRDFEFIIVDDCSTNGSDEYLRGLKDQRIKIIRNSVNMGITKSLNVALKAAHGKYIARMDSDDIAFPERFEKQYAYMESHPDTVLCGSRVEKFGASTGLGMNPINDMKKYRARILFCYPGPLHPTIMMRHETLLKNGITYDENLIYAQDYGIYSDISNYGEVYVFPQPLLKYRCHASQISSTRREIQMQCSKMVQKKRLDQLLQGVTEEELNMHYMYSSGYFTDLTISDEISDWYEKLSEANKKKKIYDIKQFDQTIVIMKRKLVEQTLSNSLHPWEKWKLCIRYLPFLEAVKVMLKKAAEHR